MQQLKNIYTILEKLLNAAQVRDFEVYFERQESRSYESKDFSVEAAQEAVQTGLALRVFRDQSIAFVYSTELHEAGLQRMVEQALQILPWVDPDEAFKLPHHVEKSLQVDLHDFDAGLTSLSHQRR